MESNDLIVRLFNPQNTSANQQITFDGTAVSVDLIALNGTTKQHLVPIKNQSKKMRINFTTPKFGVRTIWLKNFKVLSLQDENDKKNDIVIAGFFSGNGSTGSK